MYHNGMGQRLQDVICLPLALSHSPPLSSWLCRAGTRASVQRGRHQQDPCGKSKLPVGAELYAAQPVGYPGGQKGQE